MMSALRAGGRCRDWAIQIYRRRCFGGWRFGGDRRGVLLVEYALIAAVTGMVAVAAIVSLGGAANTPLQRVQAALQSALHGGHGGGAICPPKTAGDR